jgi:small conductance mechanosensitive channel
MANWLATLQSFVPALGTTGFTLLILLLANVWIKRRQQDSTSSSTTYQFLRLLLLLMALVAVILLLPISDQTQGQVLSLVSVLLTAVIALSSTTFVANAMAGLMLQSSNTIRPGDFIRVDQQFGRVTRRSLLQTQIQTEWRDLTTIPNILLINNPVTVLHREGTIISAEISLGYDIPYTQVEDLLKQAAADAGLEDPFVLAQELLDHAVAYRVAGFLPETKNLLTARSNLRKMALAILHGHGVEIVSPSYMAQRAVDPAHKVIPTRPVLHDGPQELDEVPEERIFDKAEEAANQEELREQLEQVREDIKALRGKTKGLSDTELADLNLEIEKAEAKEHWLQASIDRLMEN